MEEKITHLLSLGPMTAGTVISVMEDLGHPHRQVTASILSGVDSGEWRFGERLKLELIAE